MAAVIDSLLASLTEAPVVRSFKGGTESKVGKAHLSKVLGRQTPYTKETWHGHYRAIKVNRRLHYQGDGVWA